MAETPEPTQTPAPEPVKTPPPEKKKSRRKWLLLPLAIVLLPVVIFALWAWVTLGYVYASGERAGYVQKLSKKGWLCKTWEGELAMVNLPGSVTPQIFHFTVRNDSIATLLLRESGKRVSLTYEQHRGVPTSCFGETEYFITNVRTIAP
jgi:flagellar basal body-associated protein FliL